MFNADQIPYPDFDNMQLIIEVTKGYNIHYVYTNWVSPCCGKDNASLLEV